ncbi:MAG: response regulator [Byssovorax sp.]
MPSILIVDDDSTIRGMFARALKSLGDVELADGGGEALKLLAAKKYSVVLLDLHMPGVDGYAVLQTLATKQGPNGDTPIYLITADTSDEARIRALRRHAVFFLTKPVPIATLVSLVDSTLKMVDRRSTGTTLKLGAQAPIGGDAPPGQRDTASGRSSFNPRPVPRQAPPPDRPTSPFRATPVPPPASDKTPSSRNTPPPKSPPSRVGSDTPVPESPWPLPESPRVRPKKG